MQVCIRFGRRVLKGMTVTSGMRAGAFPGDTRALKR